MTLETQNVHILFISAGILFAGWGLGIYWTVKAALVVLRWKSSQERKDD